MKLLIGSDHAGLPLKTYLQTQLKDVQWSDQGTRSLESVDYPKIAQSFSQALLRGDAELGILICGSGIGMSIAANRHKGVRAACVSDPISARLSREHNHANVLCLGARIVAPEFAAEIVQAWLAATPSQDKRHTRRVEQLEN